MHFIFFIKVYKYNYTNILLVFILMLDSFGTPASQMEDHKSPPLNFHGNAFLFEVEQPRSVLNTTTF